MRPTEKERISNEGLMTQDNEVSDDEADIVLVHNIKDTNTPGSRRLYVCKDFANGSTEMHKIH